MGEAKPITSGLPEPPPVVPPDSPQAAVASVTARKALAARSRRVLFTLDLL
jgi:hypothetical protein